MKVFVFTLILLTFHCAVTAQSLRTGNVVGVHHLSIDLKSGVTMEKYMKFWKDIVLPVYRAQMGGVDMQTMYGLRGECETCMGLMMIIESEAVRNKYWKTDGSWTDYGLKKLQAIQFALDEMNDSYGSFISTYTDWLVGPDIESLDMDLLGASPSNTTASIKGTWALIQGEYSGKARDNKGEIYQYKFFDDKYFSLMMNPENGLWNTSAVGTYTTQGSSYAETFLHSSVPEFAGCTAVWNYRINGDTLHMEGPSIITDKDGKAAFPKMLNSVKEVRVRVD
ncbi:MAG: hypothetical protein HKN87_06770 [Saprospiraceae bacterium]|nr:hypothetical protein [Saprospiraceae bacterium]